MKFIKNFYHYTRWLIKRVQVFALFGKAGTGKSFRAKLVAQKYKIDLIIDDGILIKDNEIVAGKSAKKEKIPFTAIRTALFDDPNHLKDVRRALEKQKFGKILVIGTSRRMVDKIVSRLNLPSISKYISIEEIATKEEIETARSSRYLQGKHIIPVPGIEVQQRYSHIFLDSVKIFFKEKFRFSKKHQVFEKSVVTPEFSKRGRLAISESALIQMIMHCISEFNENIKIEKIMLKRQGEGYTVRLEIGTPFGMHLPAVIHDLQEYVISNIDKYTGIHLNEVSITIGTIS